MATKTVTAPAGAKLMPETKLRKSQRSPVDVSGVRLSRITRDGKRCPVAVYRGDAPEKGAILRLSLANGITYSGVVADATEVDGEVLVEFVDGISPSQK